jgi:hypothetical protein
MITQISTEAPPIAITDEEMSGIAAGDIKAQLGADYNGWAATRIFLIYPNGTKAEKAISYGALRLLGLK